MVFGMILPIQTSADNLSPSFYLSWPAFDTHISHGRKHFFSSFELKVSIQIVFITIVIEFFAGHLKFQNLGFFLQFLVSHIPLVSGWLRWQILAMRENIFSVVLNSVSIQVNFITIVIKKF